MAGSQNFRQFDEIFIKIEIGNTIFRLIFHIVYYMGIINVKKVLRLLLVLAFYNAML